MKKYRLFLFTLLLPIFILSGCFIVYDENLSKESDEKVKSIEEQNPDYYVKSLDDSDGNIVKSTQYSPDSGNWFKGDLHCHTTYSDGDSSTSTVVSIAEKAGLDFLAITDHNTNDCWSDDGYVSSKTTLLYGVEWTTDNGHANMISNLPFNWDNIEPTLSTRLEKYKNPGDARTAIELLHGNNSGVQETIFSINHPHNPGLTWDYSFEDSKNTDAIEAWNGQYTFPCFNFLTMPATVAIFYNNGVKVSIIGGSDSHDHGQSVVSLYNEIGNPTTFVYADSSSSLDIMKGLKAGTTFITFSPNGARVILTADYKNTKYIMGKTLPTEAAGNKVNFIVQVSNASTFLKNAFPYSLIAVYKNNRLIRFSLNKNDSYTVTFSDRPDKNSKYYAKLYQLPSEMNVYSVFSILQISQIKTFTSSILSYQ